MSGTNKRNPTDGFCKDTMEERVKLIQKYNSSWRRLEQRKVVVTTLNQTFLHTPTGQEVMISHVCPWGMREYLSALLSHDKCKNWNVLPQQVKQHMPELTTKEKYLKDQWEVSIKHSGPSEPRLHYRLFCNHCQYVLIPKLVTKYKDELGSDQQNIDGLIAKWDELKIPSKFVDYIGCFLPWEKNVHAAPNARKYIRDQSEHPKTSHPETVQSLKKPSKSATLASPPPKKVIVLDKSSPSLPQTILAAKTSKKHAGSKQMTLEKYSTSIPLTGQCVKPMHVIGKGMCLSIVHTGVNKKLSQTAIIDNYNASFNGCQLYYETAEQHMKVNHPEVNIPPPVKVCLNKDNIIKAEKAILDAYRFDDPESLTNQIKKSPFYSIMHDGISKFSTEFNGVYLKGIDLENKSFCVPHCLNRMKGGVNAYDVADDIISTISSCNPLGQRSAFHTINRNIADSFPDDTHPVIDPVPPNYFKLGTVMNVLKIQDDAEDDVEEMVINIEVDEKFPIANTGDGVATNSKAARVLRDLYGIFTPEFRCSAHAASGSIKRLATSKTMNVPDVTTLYECLRRVVKHFECSVKNKEILDDALEILESTPLNLISWCQTRMAHFLKASRIFDEMLPGIYDVMYTKGVKEDDRDTLFTPKNNFILKIMSDLDHVFNSHYLRKADKGDLLVSTVYNIAHSFADTMVNFSSTNAQNFVDSLKFDQHGNLQATLGIKGSENKHTITLNYPHKPARNQTQEERLNKLKEELESLNEDIRSNIVENVRDQCDSSTYYYSWSGLDLELPLSLDERKKRLKDVVAIYCCDRYHTVSEYTLFFYKKPFYKKLVLKMPKC